MPGSTLLLVLDLVGVLAFAVDGALTASRTARLDVVGVITLGVITALGGGIMRDLLIGRVPPATFSDWRYLAVAATGGVLVCLFGHRMGRRRVARSLTVLDAADFPDGTVWGHYGRDYGWVPLVLPLLGLAWLRRTRPATR